MNSQIQKHTNDTPHGSTWSYFIGYSLSVFLTLCAFYPAALHLSSSHEKFSHELLIPIFLCLALVQLVIQLAFFLHLGHEKKPRWNLIFFLSTAGVIMLIVVGSLWIMSHLNYNMTPHQINDYLQSEEGIHSHSPHD